MADRDAVYAAMRNADKAGDADAVRALAAHLKAMDAPAAKPKGANGFPATVTAMKGLAQGALGLADLVTGPVRLGYGMALDYAGNKLGGDTGAMLREAADKSREGASGALNRALPTPEAQQGVRAVFEGVGGAAGGVGLARAAVARLGVKAAPMLRAMAGNPVTQVVAGGVGAGAAEGVRESGGSVPMQVGAGVAAGLLAPGSVETAIARGVPMATRARAALPAGVEIVAQGGRALMPPVTTNDVRLSAAAVLREAAVNPAAAAARMRGAAPAVSGALPTAAEVSGDEGIAGFQRSIGNLSNGELKTRQDANMLARSRAIDGTMGPGDVEALPAAARQQAAALASQQRGAVEAVGPLNPVETSGEWLRAQLQRGADASKARAQALYAKVPTDADPIQVGAVEPNDMRGAGFDPARVTFEAEGRAATGGAGALARAGFETAAKPKGSLLGWIRSRGGIVDDGSGDLASAGLTPKAMPGLFSNNRGSFTKGAARSNRGVMGNRMDDLRAAMVEEGWLPEGATIDDAKQAIISDFAGAGRSGTGVRAQKVAGEMTDVAMDSADDVSDYWGKELQDRGLSPDRMTSEDWDALYRDMSGKGPVAVSQDDAAFLGQSADNAEGRALLSPFQVSLINLRRQFFPGTGLPADSSVSALLRQLENADVLEAPQVERIVTDLRRQAGLIKVNDGRSASLAKSAANAAEGLLMAQAGPARAAAIKEARAAWRGYKATYGEREAGKALATNAFNRETLDAARVPGAVVPSGVTGATATRRLADATSPETAAAAVREEVRRALDVAGPAPAAIDRVARNYAGAIEATPGLGEVVNAAKQSAAAVEAFARSRLGSMVDGKVSASETVAQALRARDNGKAFLQLRRAVAGNAEAEAGMRRAAAEFVVPDAVTANYTAGLDAVQSNLKTLDRLDRTLKQSALSGLFKPEQVKALKALRKELESAQFAASAARPAGSNTSRDLAVTSRMAKMVLRDAPTGGFGRAAAFVLDVVAKTDDVRAVLQQAMLDPKFAADLLMTPTPERLQTVRARLQPLSGASIGALSVADKPSAYSPASM